MSDTALLVSGACILVVMFLLWRSGLWGARAYGNQLAKFLGINKILVPLCAGSWYRQRNFDASERVEAARVGSSSGVGCHCTLSGERAQES